MVWSCMPRPDGDPVFNALLGGISPQDEKARGVFGVDIENFASSQQSYFTNTPVLVTRLQDTAGQAIDVIDFAPRFNRFGRRHRPVALIRIIRPVTGRPRVRIRLRPAFSYGAEDPVVTRGSNHIRFVGDRQTLRLTTDAPVAYITDETWFRLEKPLNLFLGPDETIAGSVSATCEEYLTATDSYWREWVRTLAVPLEWQDAVIRAASHDHVDPGSGQFGPYMGLSFLLAAGRLLRRARAEPPGRHRHHGELSFVPAQSAGVDRGPAYAAGVRPCP
jgi:hypothetical protein